MVDRIVVPKDIYALTPNTCVRVTLHDKSYSTDMVKLRTLSWEGYPGLFRGPMQSQGTL